MSNKVREMHKLIERVRHWQVNRKNRVKHVQQKAELERYTIVKKKKKPRETLPTMKEAGNEQPTNQSN